MKAIAGERFRLAREGPEIVDNRRDVRRLDWRLIRIPHFIDLALPDGPRQTRLRQNHAGGMTGEAVVVDEVGPGAFKSAIAVREVPRDCLQRSAAAADCRGSPLWLRGRFSGRGAGCRP